MKCLNCFKKKKIVYNKDVKTKRYIPWTENQDICSLDLFQHG